MALIYKNDVPLPNYPANGTAHFAFIGGGASTLLTLAFLIRDLKNLSVPANKKIVLHVLDPKGLNPGLAYSPRNSSIRLNQPAGDDMNVFLNSGPGLPKPFLDYLVERHPGYDALSFVARGLFGDYLGFVGTWLTEQVAHTPHISLNIVRTKVTDIRKCPLSRRYNIAGANGICISAHGLVLATGHTATPRATHDLYLPAYTGDQFEERLQKIVQDPKPKIIIGSGASMADIVCALESLGCKSPYHVISRRGWTGWIHNSTPTPSAKEEKESLQKIVDQIITLNSKSPTEAVREILQRAAFETFAPQHTIETLLKQRYVRKDAHLLAAVEAFYGNPLSPERYGILAELKATGRLIFEHANVENVEVRHNDLWIDCGAGTRRTDNHVIDCAIIGRGIFDKQGSVPDPLIRSMLDHDLLTLRSGDPRALSPRPCSDRWIAAVGPLTNTRKNGLGTFRKGYINASNAICAWAQDVWRGPHTPGPVTEPIYGGLLINTRT